MELIHGGLEGQLVQPFLRGAGGLQREEKGKRKRRGGKSKGWRRKGKQTRVGRGLGLSWQMRKGNKNNRVGEVG